MKITMSLLDVIAVFGLLVKILAPAGLVCDVGEFAHTDSGASKGQVCGMQLLL